MALSSVLNSGGGPNNLLNSAATFGVTLIVCFLAMVFSYLGPSPNWVGWLNNETFAQPVDPGARANPMRSDVAPESRIARIPTSLRLRTASPGVGHRTGADDHGIPAQQGRWRRRYLQHKAQRVPRNERVMDRLDAFATSREITKRDWNHKNLGRKAQRPVLRIVPTAASQRPRFVIGSSKITYWVSKMDAAKQPRH